jgi:peptide/nickel transport system substrate-binding protein
LIHDWLTPRAFQMALTAFDNGPDPDVFPFWHSSQAHPGGYNFTSLPLKQYAAFIDNDLEQGRDSLSLSDRAQAYALFQQDFAREEPAVPLYSPAYAYAITRQMHGVRLDSALEPADRFDYVNEWYLEVGR